MRRGVGGVVNKNKIKNLVGVPRHEGLCDVPSDGGGGYVCLQAPTLTAHARPNIRSAYA